MALKTLALLAAAHLTQAHFGIEYPPMRADTLSASHEQGAHYSQWTQPCTRFPPYSHTHTQMQEINLLNLRCRRPG